MKFLQEHRDAIACACERFKRGDKTFKGNWFSDMQIEGRDSAVFVYIKASHTSTVVKEVLEFSRKHGASLIFGYGTDSVETLITINP